MHIPKNYFHDRLVLLLLSINTFLTVMGSLLVLLRLDSNRADGYFIEYRSNLGLSAFKSGNGVDMASFAVFSLFVFFVHAFISIRIYNIRRSYALAILGMGSLLLLVSLIVSNALLVLRS